MNVSPKIIAEAQKFNPDNIVILFELDMRSLGGNIFRFTPMLDSERSLYLENFGEILLQNGTSLELEDDGGDLIKWRGNPFYPLPAEASGFEMSSTGSFPRPVLTVANVLGTLESEINQYNKLKGATVTRWRTFVKHLDGGTDPDPDIYFPPDIFKIDRISEDTPGYLQFELATVLDQEGVMLPRRQILRNTCTHIYRVWDAKTNSFDYSKATCPYVEDRYYDENGKQVFSPALDKASKLTETCCKRRFPNQALPTRAFPGVGRFR